MKKNSKKKGFTLIELIVVIAILGILALIAIPRLGGFTSSAKERADIATATTIGHAAEAYMAANPTTTLTSLTGTELEPTFLSTGTMAVLSQVNAGTWAVNVTYGTGGDFTIQVTDGTTVRYTN